MQLRGNPYKLEYLEILKQVSLDSIENIASTNTLAYSARLTRKKNVYTTLATQLDICLASDKHSSLFCQATNDKEKEYWKKMTTEQKIKSCK